MASECDKRGPYHYGICTKKKQGMADEQAKCAADTGQALCNQKGSELQGCAHDFSSPMGHTPAEIAKPLPALPHGYTPHN